MYIPGFRTLPAWKLKCKVCGLEGHSLDEVCWWDINGFSHCDEFDIERYSGNPDALAHALCFKCAEEFDFSKGY